ncbi:MAG: hypothetical protein A2086_16410 [Spirochaetes bacterium GWD1_27_9]|nr:MAG: hypothetical protein A2Y34_16605 [Spirochaetes bacterium GWC1_27_15]OHD33015.1 MAG: hypothetical protein A2086_16410 [Spirochaetes bacterium GWD1_27_9]
MKKLLFLLFSLIFISFGIFSQSRDIDIEFLHKGKYYSLKPVNNKSFELNNIFYPLIEIDNSQVHRVILTSTEKTKLLSLNFVGDSYEFNNIQIIHKNKDVYSIIDKINNLKVNFGIGDYDCIILYSVIKFTKKELNLFDKIATVIFVKTLLKKIEGEFSLKIDIPELIEQIEFDKKIIAKITNEKLKDFILKMYQFDEKRNFYILKDIGKNKENRDSINNILIDISFYSQNGYKDLQKIEAYQQFIFELKRLKKNETFSYIRKYIQFNFKLIMDNKITSDWISPYDLYYNKEGNYKSIAFFYYNTLKELDFNVKSYFVTDLRKRPNDEINQILNLSLEEKQKLEREYKYVKSSYNLDELRFYYSPNFLDSTYIITVEIDGKWLYTTGNDWIDAGIYKSERVCSHYARKGCYYSLFEKDKLILENIPINEKDILWDVFYELK